MGTPPPESDGLPLDYPQHDPEVLLSVKTLNDLREAARFAVTTREGEILQPGEAVERIYRLLADKEIQIDSLQRQLTGKGIAMRRMRAEQFSKLHTHPLYVDARSVLERWSELCLPGARELEGGDRLKCVIDRLTGEPPFTVEQLNQCSLGYSYMPYVVEGRRTRFGTPAQRKIDAELIFRDPKHVQQGIAFAAEMANREAVIPGAAVSRDAANDEAISALGQAAVRLANFGWHIFPVKPRAKVPATQHGLLDATRDIERITAYWQRNPGHNIGVRCGAESGIVVLDVDDRNGGFEALHEIESKMGRLPQTLSVKTPGGGTHLYFHHPGGVVGNTAGFPGPGLDMRGDGGYVLAPPSVGDNGRWYEVDEQVPIADMPVWLREALFRHRQATSDLSTDEWVDRIMRDVPEGGRDNALTSITGKFVSMGIADEYIFSLVMAQNRAYCKPPLPSKDVERIVKSILSRDKRKRNRQALEQLKMEETIESAS